jgi:4-hydroxythreonine-4-phosphate dehydrogenase
VSLPVALCLGCPSGIGPEVAVLAASQSPERILLVGDLGVVARAARLRGLDPGRFVRVRAPRDATTLARGRIAVIQPTGSLVAEDIRYGAPSTAGGAAQLAWVDATCDLARSGEARAMVTGPVSKDAIARSGAPGSRRFSGHTEHIQRRLRAREVVMAFYSDALTTALVTTHLPLRKVADSITRAGVASASFWLVDLLVKLGKGTKRRPRVVLAALNPHAGEHGLFGDEESRILAPALALARRRVRSRGLVALLEGPMAAETAFRLAAAKQFDGVVALYHDQATIPMKLLGFGEAVNVSLGLPIVRTSVDHGTAYDLAGTGAADASAMGAAIDLAVRLTRPKSQRRKSA